MSTMKTRDFDFYLPPELIAQFPVPQRTGSRMLYVNSPTAQWHDTVFSELSHYVRKGDVIVFNDTQVIKARLKGIKKMTGGKVEVMVERILDDHHVLAGIRSSHAPKTDAQLRLADVIEASVTARENEFYTLHFHNPEPVAELLERYGQLPLPPYIERCASTTDEARYQTIYARNPGAVAAPTAGLHFDPDMMNTLQSLNVVIAYVTLHVGAGTFQPIRAENIADHVMHHERFHIPQSTASAIEHAQATGGKILAVGTTTLRALEACATAHHGRIVEGYGDTNIFITPGYRFQIVERLLTNFHLPRSTLLMLVSAFSGMDLMRKAYQHAINSRYRFFSYGDAMLIERQL